MVLTFAIAYIKMNVGCLLLLYQVTHCIYPFPYVPKMCGYLLN